MIGYQHELYTQYQEDMAMQEKMNGFGESGLSVSASR
ncbi:hypothetical protein QFZ48_004281 [Chitinophaga sp. W2I13]